MRLSPKRVGRLLSRPNWLAAHLRGRRQASLRDRELARGTSTAFTLSDHQALVRNQDEAIQAVTGASAEEVEAASKMGWIPDPAADDQTAWDSREVLLGTLAALVHLLEPKAAIEVGVERGYSSAVILHGMRRAGGGRLFSIDLPPVEADVSTFTGSVIPPELRPAWDLTLGPSRSHLPDVASRAGSIDLFLHDGDHSYESQFEDLAEVWLTLRSGGVAVVDDVWSAAPIDFATSVGEEPVLIRRWDDHDAIGLIRKSP